MIIFSCFAILIGSKNLYCLFAENYEMVLLYYVASFVNQFSDVIDCCCCKFYIRTVFKTPSWVITKKYFCSQNELLLNIPILLFRSVFCSSQFSYFYDYFNCFLHAFDRYIFIFSMEIMSSCKDIRTR